MMPVIDGKTIEEEEFDKLDDDVKKQFEEKSGIVQEQIMEVIAKIKEIERASDKHLEEWQANIALLTVNSHINYIKNKYKRNKKVNKFLTDIKQDILKNISIFTSDDSKNQGQQQAGPRQESPKPWLNYQIGRAHV